MSVYFTATVWQHIEVIKDKKMSPIFIELAIHQLDSLQRSCNIILLLNLVTYICACKTVCFSTDMPWEKNVSHQSVMIDSLFYTAVSVFLLKLLYRCISNILNLDLSN